MEANDEYYSTIITYVFVFVRLVVVVVVVVVHLFFFCCCCCCCCGCGCVFFLVVVMVVVVRLYKSKFIRHLTSGEVAPKKTGMKLFQLTCFRPSDGVVQPLPHVG